MVQEVVHELVMQCVLASHKLHKKEGGMGYFFLLHVRTHLV